jgi:hypothetical protein
MKKLSLFPLFAALSLLLCGLAASPAPASDAKPSEKIEITTVIASGGSGSLEYKVTLSKEFMDLLKESPGFDENETCNMFFEHVYGDWDKSDSTVNGALTCSAQAKFEDLDELASAIESDYSGASFERLEIKGGTLYYDLAPHIDGSSMVMGSDYPIDVEAWWIVEVPGDVSSTNADITSGRTVKWDLLKLSTSSHIKVEAATSGGALGLDPTVTILVVIALMGCCCLVVIVIGVAVFFFLRRKKAPEAAA